MRHPKIVLLAIMGRKWIVSTACLHYVYVRHQVPQHLRTISGLSAEQNAKEHLRRKSTHQHCGMAFEAPSATASATPAAALAWTHLGPDKADVERARAFSQEVAVRHSGQAAAVKPHSAKRGRCASGVGELGTIRVLRAAKM